ncbi:DNA mismatch repair protein MutS [Saltatorellus ferox]|uniref:DNA mismatch repair protein MutS n=1 Tax=Saltatorellus ferox TaxID=2528018 RepID=UPI003AF3A10C
MTPSPQTSPSGSGKTKVTMMDQFNAAKKEAGDAIVFFRMGDFYELFGTDAEVASRELGIALTSRSKGADAMPMAGVPVKSMEPYLMRLVRAGFKVAVCEQMSDPRTTKGIVDRGIVRVVTAGTITEEDELDARSSNYLAALMVDGKRASVAYVDLSTGRAAASADLDLARVTDEIARIAPAELLVPEDLPRTAPDLAEALQLDLGPRITWREPWHFSRESALRVLKDQFRVGTLEGFGFDDQDLAVCAAGAAIDYARETQRGGCDHLLRLEKIDTGQHLVLDRATRSCLELTQTQRGARREGSLLDAIDSTLTPMGGRMMRDWLLSPLRDVERIVYRQRGVAEFVDGPFLREDVRSLLNGVLDIERLVAKLSTGRVNARDLNALSGSLRIVTPLRTKIAGVYSKALGDLSDALDPLTEVVESIDMTIVESPPMTIKEGGVIAAGISSDLDELRQIAGDGKAWMARFQGDAIERYGIPGLKIGFNSVFGYYLEVPRGQVKQVPTDFVRKQTLKNAERYITPELKEFEDKVLRAEERAKDMEYEIFNALKDQVAAEIPRILGTARSLAEIDVLAGLAQTAATQRYCAPTVDGGDTIEIKDGRHPVIEAMQKDVTFVPNDTTLDRKKRSVGIITGPNMAGKSTYIRQTALIVLLAQIGSFVPASSAKVGVCDRIFTRIGSADDLSRGASTFMVEMVEIANILNNASTKSLVVLDEVGRGTSTFDGLALAWAIVEHMHDVVRARTLFATHYHQLTELSDKLTGVHNLSVAVREWDDEIVFLHQIIEGGTDRSYGIQVARLAGVPDALIGRAREVLRDIETDSDDLGARILQKRHVPDAALLPPGMQLGLFDNEPSQLEKTLAEIDVESTTPMEALQLLAKLKELSR